MPINWEDHETYLVGKSEGIVFGKKNKFACFDLDDTLITPKSGNKFATSGDDWKFMFPNVVDKLLELNTDKYIVVIITNQAGISKNKNNVGVKEWKNKIGMIVEKLGIPIIIYASLDHDHYRKPFPTFWEMLTNNLDNNSEQCVGKSFYCGDACGRKTDFSDSDIKFAHNCGIKFILPEMVFCNIGDKKIKPPKINYPIDFDNIASGELNFVPHDKELIIMIGYPGSGKSTFVRNYISKNNYSVINRDTLKTMQRCIHECEKYMTNGKSIVIDNTNPSIDDRKKFIELAKLNKYIVRCFVMDTSIELSKHNSYYRNYISNGKINHIPDIAYNIYKKKFTEPIIEEGFSEIIKVPFSLDNSVDESKYRMYFICNK